jgi:hypothetical protein
MFDFLIPDFNIDSIIETEATKQLNSENILDSFIGRPFNYKIIPESETMEILNVNELSEHKPNNKENTKNHLFSIITHKKRGRINSRERKNIKPHDKFFEDNIVRKLQVNYINFITNFINEILKEIGREDLQFITLDYLYKRKVDKEHRNKLKNKTIGEVLSNNISPKFKTKNMNKNIETVEIIKKENINILINILNKEIFFFFDKIYFKNYRNFNLKEFGFDDLEIKLPKHIKLFEDLLIKNKKEIHYEEYKARIYRCANKYFLQKENDIFKCNY